MAYGLGGFASGLSEGFKSGWSYAEKMDERDKKRRAEQLGKEIAELDPNYQHGEGEFGKFGPMHKQPTDQAAPPAATQEPPPAAGISQQPNVVVTPLKEESAPVARPIMDAPTRGLSGTQSGYTQPKDESPRPAVEEKPALARMEPQDALFKSKYKDQAGADKQYYSLMQSKLTELYSVTGQYDKIPMVRSYIKKMQDEDFEPIKRFGSALIGQGSSRGFDYLNRAAQVAGFDMQVDASGAKFNQETNTWEGLQYVTGGGKNVSDPVNATVGQLWQQIGSITPLEAFNMNVANTNLGLAKKREDREQTKFEQETDTFEYNKGRRSQQEKVQEAQLSLLNAQTDDERASAKERLAKAGYYRNLGQDGIPGGKLKASDFRTLMDDLMPQDPWGKKDIEESFGDERKQKIKDNQLAQQKNARVRTIAEGAWRMPENRGAAIGELAEAAETVALGKFSKFSWVKNNPNLLVFRSSSGREVYVSSSVLPPEILGNGQPSQGQGSSQPPAQQGATAKPEQQANVSYAPIVFR
jgi:hypothetical protein